MAEEDRRKIFGSRLRRLRKNKELTQRELGAKVGVTEAAIGMWESAKRLPDPETMTRLAQILGVSVDYLLGNDLPDGQGQPDSFSASWWHRDTPPDPVELEEFLRKANIHFNGAPLDEEDKRELIDYLRYRWWKKRKEQPEGGEQNGRAR